MTAPAAVPWDARAAPSSATSQRVSVKAVKTVVTMPMAKVTAKPFTGPEPSKNSTAAAISVVTLVSMIVASALGETGVDRLDHRAPAASLLADALIDQHVGVHRHADGQHDAGDAGQSQRRAEQRQDRDDHRHVERQARCWR